MAPGFIPLAVRICLYIFFEVGVHPGPPVVPSNQLNALVLSEVFCHIAVVFGLEYCFDHWFWYVETVLVVEYVAILHGQVLG